MRIGIDASCLPPLVAGAGRYICGLVSALSDLDARNQYFVFTKRRDLPRFPDLRPNFELVALPNFDRAARIFWQWTAPRRLVRKYGLQVWHAPHYVLPKDLEDVLSVVTFHDMTFFLLPELYGSIKTFFFQRMITDAVERANVIITISEATTNDTRALFGPLRNKLTQVYSGTNGSFRPVRSAAAIEEVKSRYGTGERFILFVGTLDKRKNVPTLIQSFSRLVRNGQPDLRLVLVGQSENADAEIAASIDDAGMQEKVVRTGYLPDRELPALYSAASLFVYPSHYEGFGFPVLEAMACGTPVLTSNNSAMRELAELPQIQVEPSNCDDWVRKMDQVLSDKHFRQRIVHHGLQRSKQLTWEATARRMLEVYSRADGDRNTRISTTSPPFKLNGHKRAFDMPAGLKDVTPISRAVLQTLTYSSLFEYPLSVCEIHQGLIAEKTSLGQVKEALTNLAKRKYVESVNGFYFLRGQQSTVANRKVREQTSEEILRKNRRLLKLIATLPFVRAAALSGAVAFRNCLHKDDIDLFLIVDSKRVWTVYFFLALLLKLRGKRNLICLNYLFAKANLTVAFRDFFVAHQIANLRPISGNRALRGFWEANRWLKDFLPQSVISGDRDTDVIARFKTTRARQRSKSALEKLLGLRALDWVERVIFRLYGAHVRRITARLNGSVTVAKDEIKLFTNDHRGRILEDFRTQLMNLKEGEHEH